MDLLDWAKSVAALVATLALIGLTAVAARRFGLIGVETRSSAGRRLKVVESLMLDPRRRLVLIKCDEREHLMLLSPAGDVSIESFESKPQAQA